MSKKRATRSTTKSNHQNLMQYEFKNDRQEIIPIDLVPSQQKEQVKPKRQNKRSKTQSVIQKRQEPSLQVNQNLIQAHHSNTISLKRPNMKKKKVSKEEENEGLRIVKEKETEKIFKHFCTPEGTITVNSLGSVLARAKKQFQTEDVQNMIAYFDTIRKTIETNNQQKDKRSAISQPAKRQKFSSKNQLGKNLNRQQSQSQVSQSDEQMHIDQDMQLDLDSQGNMKTELNYQEFKLLLKYFDKE